MTKLGPNMVGISASIQRDTMDGIVKFMATNNINRSEAIRRLLRLGLTTSKAAVTMHSQQP